MASPGVAGSELDSEIEEIDLTKVFKHKLGLDELENYNDYLSEIRNTSQDVDSKVELVNKNYFPVSTQFDVNRAELSPNNMDVLVDIRNKNIGVINELASIFKVKMRNVKHIRFKGNQEDGIIDARSVYKIPNNIDDHIFERAFVKPNDKVIVTVALDISGSMDKDFTAGGRRLLETAVILDAALTKAMIKHEVVGYGAPADRDVAALNGNESLYTRVQHRLETITYRSFAGANGLGNIEVKCWDNADGESLRNIAYRLLKSRSKMKVIINISDGKPYLHGGDAGVLDNDLLKTINWLGANKVKLYALGFNDYPQNLYGPDYMKIDDYKQLPKFFRDAK
jgi:cobalamin biosynthesis protein CobT